MIEIFSFDNLMFFFPRVLKALPVTLMITLVSTVSGTLLGIIIALIKNERIPLLNQIVTILVSFLRGTPLLVQLSVVYFGFPVLLRFLGIESFRMNQMTAVYIAYGLNTAAFLSETVRSSLLSVPKNQMEAAMSLGYSSFEAYKDIIIPQAISIAIPDYGVKIVGLLQSTAIAFNIGIIDMMGTVKSLSTIVSSQLEGYVAATLVYMVFSLLLSKIFSKLSETYSFS